MLVPTRKLNEQILIGGNVRIKVIMIRRNQVRLAVEAPRDVSIYRAELTNSELLRPVSPRQPSGAL